MPSTKGMLMLALIAALLFLLSLLSVSIGAVNLVTAGLLFVALHLALGGYVPALPARRQV